MARIIEKENSVRRLIKLSSDDIISIVQDYQRIVPRSANIKDARSYLEDTIIYIPEEV
jgi:hypothetical protein